MQCRCRTEENQGKCIRQSVPSVAKNVKYHSSLTEADLFTAENAIPKKEEQGDTELKR